MPFVLLFAGILLITVAIRNQQTAFVQLLRGDFSGQGNFMYWVVAVIMIGVIGYIPKAKPVADLFLVLLLIVLVLYRGNPNSATGGVFSQLTKALGATNTAAQNTSLSSLLGVATSAAAGAVGGGA